MPATARRNHATRHSSRKVVMEKLKLPVESLRVETFDGGGVTEAAGTVDAREASGPDGGCCTHLQTGCNPDITTVFTGSCHNC